MQQKIESSLDDTVNSFLNRNLHLTPEQIAEHLRDLDDHITDNASQAEAYLGIPSRLWVTMAVKLRVYITEAANGNGTHASIEKLCMIFFACGWLERAALARKEGG